MLNDKVKFLEKWAEDFVQTSNIRAAFMALVQ